MRAIRYALEAGPVQVVANDQSADACEGGVSAQLPFFKLTNVVIFMFLTLLSTDTPQPIIISAAISVP